MARLINELTGEILQLKAHHSFGRRASSVDTLLANKDVSQVHASIRWTGHHWHLHDHSRNGTSLNGAKISKERRTPIQIDQVICFAKESCWKVLDDAPPQNMLICLGQPRTVVVLDKFHALPAEEQPSVSLYLAENGQWMCEDIYQIRSLKDGDLIHHDRQTWRFFSAGSEATTLSRSNEIHRKTIQHVQFHFQVSSDEEYVSLKIIMGNQILDLGERAHHYTLLTLARRRLKERLQQIDNASCGWYFFEEFCRILHMDPQHVNIHIYRARKQMMQFFPDANYLPNVVERRSGSLRFGFPFLKVHRGDILEGEMAPPSDE